MSSMVAVGSARDAREDDSEPCRVTDFLCRVLLRSARKAGCTLRLALGEVGTWGKTAAVGGGSAPSACVRRVLSFRLGRVGGGARLADDLAHGCGCGCGLTTATLGEVLPENTAGISIGGRGSSVSGGGGGKSESEGGDGNSAAESLRAPRAGALAGAPPCCRAPGRCTPERLSFPGFGGAAGGPGSAAEANLLTRLSTEGRLGSGGSAPAPDLMLELRWGVGGGFLRRATGARLRDSLGLDVSSPRPFSTCGCESVVIGGRVKTESHIDFEHQIFLGLTGKRQ